MKMMMKMMMMIIEIIIIIIIINKFFLVYDMTASSFDLNVFYFKKNTVTIKL